MTDDKGTIRIKLPSKKAKKEKETLVCKKCKKIPEFINFKAKVQGKIHVEKKRREEAGTNIEFTCGNCNEPLNLSDNDFQYAFGLADVGFEADPVIIGWDFKDETKK